MVQCRESARGGVAGKRPVVTIFSIPRAFEGMTGVHQRNAIASWRRLGSGVEVLLFGDEPGVAEIADEFELFHIPEIQQNWCGTPILSDAFSRSQEFRPSSLFAFVNTDIILTEDFLSTLQKLEACKLNPYLAIGTRSEKDIHQLLDFDDPSTMDSLRQQDRTRWSRASIVCKDYFIFPHGVFQEIPPFAVGRGNWDNWMVHTAKQNRTPVIDVSRCMDAFHPKHGYAHAGGKRYVAYLSGQEARENQRLAGGRHLVSGATANWKMTPNSLKRVPFPVLHFAWDLPRFIRLAASLGVSLVSVAITDAVLGVAQRIHKKNGGSG